MIAPAGDAPTQARAIELVLAHMHLRLASLALARVELETLAGLGGLDMQGLVDLAEVRWRTGDLVGAGEAAAAALRVDDVRPDPIALVVAAEAASAIGRPSEARRLATRATAAAPHSIDEIFAGMPRSGVWVPDANEPLPTAPTLFDRAPESAAAPQRPAEPAAPAPQPAAAAVVAQADRDGATVAGPMTMGFWDGDGTVDQTDVAEPDPAREFEAGRQALVAGSFDEAALRFGLALRLAPALALAVLEATEGARAASLSVVRGDAYRSAGHETEARQAYAIAAKGGLPERRSTVRIRPKPAPGVVAEPDDPDEIDPATNLDGTDGMNADAAAPDEPETVGSTDTGREVTTTTGAAGAPDTESPGA
jgi:tetratricopeptide (TPR) repeat protein